MGNPRHLYSPNPTYPAPRSGSGDAAYLALSNLSARSNTAGGNPLPASDEAFEIVAPLTSRIGGRFRCAGSIFGTTTAGDVVRCAMEVDINSTGWQVIALAAMLADTSGRFSAAFDVLSPAIPAGQTIWVRLHFENLAFNPITANTADAQVTVNAQEQPA